MAHATESNRLNPLNPHAIARISVEKLFGQFTYQLPLKSEIGQDLSHLFILYGDNGSGKTTILRTVFHLLSPEDGRGHKSAVTKVPFRRFAVELADGTTIEALRPGKVQAGPYRAAILKGAETIEAVELPLEASGRGEAKEEGRGRLRAFLKHLSSLKIALYFLSDDRRIQGRETEEELIEARRSRAIMSSGIVYTIAHGEEEPSAAGALGPAVHQAFLWITQQAHKSSNTGQRNVHSIYTDIAKHIVESPVTVDPADVKHQVGQLVSQLQTLSEKSGAYSEFGLISELPVDGMLASFQSALPDKLPVLYSVMRPYAQSIEARLKALEGIYNLLETFVGNINMFFGTTKQVAFDLRRGFSIRTKGGTPIDFDMLSSGEKQLLLLMCNTLSARDQASILIIDEPEISLNIKWQRRLVQALLDCISGSNVQLIFATHSIELLAQHKSQVVKLIDLAELEKAGHHQDQPDEHRREPDNRRVGSEV